MPDCSKLVTLSFVLALLLSTVSGLDNSFILRIVSSLLDVWESFEFCSRRAEILNKFVFKFFFGENLKGLRQNYNLKKKKNKKK